MASERALFVEGIGHLDQYGSYVETFWEKNVCYYLRDYYVREIEEMCERGEQVRPLVARLNALNSEIQKWEYERSHGNRSDGGGDA